jgi:hypothetical protein
VLAFGGVHQAAAHLAIEGGVLPLGGVADPVEPAAARSLARQVILSDLVEESALVEGVERAEAHAP